MASKKRPGKMALMGKRHPSQPAAQCPKNDKSRSLNRSPIGSSESDDPATLGRDLDRCARLLHQMLETDSGSYRSKLTKKGKMCHKDESRRSVKQQGVKTQTKARPPLVAVENHQKATPTLIMPTPGDKAQNQEPMTPQALFNRRLSSSTPEPSKQYEPFPQFPQDGQQWNQYYQQYQQSDPIKESHLVEVTLPSSPANYSMNQAPALTATHPSSVHPTMSYKTPIPTTHQGGNSPTRGRPALVYPSGYASFPGVYYSPAHYSHHSLHQTSASPQYQHHPYHHHQQQQHLHHSSSQQHHSPPTRLNIEQSAFRSLANIHFNDELNCPPERVHQSPPQRPVPRTSEQSPPRPDSPRPLEPVDESPELVEGVGFGLEKAVHFENPIRGDCWPASSAVQDCMEDCKTSFSTDNVRNKMATLHYLLGELRVLSEGDMEISRLVGEVQTTVEDVNPLKSVTSFQTEVEMALQPLRSENSQLRRRLRILNHQLKEREKKEKENVRPDTNFDLAHVQAKYEALQAKYNEEKEKSARLQQDVYRMQGQLEEVKTDRAKLVIQLSEKETEQMKIKHDWLHESTRLKKDLDSYNQRLDDLKHKCELLDREKHILQLTVQQRDTDLTRVQDLLHEYKNRYQAKSSPITNLSPSNAGPSRLTRQALEEFNKSPQNALAVGHKSPIERLGLDNTKTPGCSPKLTQTKESKKPPSERSRDEKKEKPKRVKTPLMDGQSSSTPEKKEITVTTELDNSNISSVSRDSRCTTPTLVSTNVPSASQVNASQVVMPTMASRLVIDSSVSTVSTEASTIPMTTVTARYQPSTMCVGAQLTGDSTKFTAPSTLTQDSVSKTKAKHLDESDRYAVTDYFQKYGSSAVERYQHSSATTGIMAEDSKSDVTLMTNSSLSSISSQDDRSFRAGLANLDANIARLQMALKTAPSTR